MDGFQTEIGFRTALTHQAFGGQRIQMLVGYYLKIKTLRCCLLAAVFAASFQSGVAANLADFSDFSLTSGDNVVLPGRLYIPPQAKSDRRAPRPLILFLHGGGERGSNNHSQVNVNMDNLLAEAKRRGAYLYAPQSPGDWNSRAITDQVMTMIDRAIAEQNVDKSRLYVTGLSSGGCGTWNMLNRYPDRFAAGIPICAGSPDTDFVPGRLVDHSIYVFHS